MNASLDQLTFINDKVAQTVSSTAKNLSDLGFTAAEIGQARALLITVETDAVRWRIGTPTAANGHKIEAGDYRLIQGKKLMDDIKFIRVTTDATIHVSLFK